MRVYISGPITGREQDAALRFEQAERAIHKRYRCETINPERIGRYAAMCAGLSQEDYMHLALAEMEICDAVYFMEGWQRSAGCKTEYAYAIARNMRFIDRDDTEEGDK